MTDGVRWYAGLRQRAVYAAEDALEASRSYARFTDVDALRTWLDDMLARYWFAHEYWMIDRVDIEVSSMRGCVAASDWDVETRTGTLTFAPGQLTEINVAHELSHVLTEARYPAPKPGNGHNEWFARTYLETTYRLLGSDAYVALRDAFDEAYVDYNPMMR